GVLMQQVPGGDGDLVALDQLRQPAAGVTSDVDRGRRGRVRIGDADGHSVLVGHHVGQLPDTNRRAGNGPGERLVGEKQDAQSIVHVAGMKTSPVGSVPCWRTRNSSRYSQRSYVAASSPINTESR